MFTTPAVFVKPVSGSLCVCVYISPVHWEKHNQHGLFTDCCTDPWEVHRLLSPLWSPIRPLVVHHSAWWPHSALRQCRDEPGKEIWTHLQKWANIRCLICWKQLIVFFIVQAHLPEHHRPVPPYGQTSSCCKHTEVHSCRRKTQWPWWCGQRCVPSYFLRDVGLLVLWRLFQSKRWIESCCIS